MKVAPDGEEWASTPPSWALPVTVAGDLVLVRQGGVLVSMGAVSAYPMGFEFYLTVGFDLAQAAERRARTHADRILGFHARTPREQVTAARVAVGLAGRTVADSMACMNREFTRGEPIVAFAGGDAGIPAYAPALRAESRWWVSPLPPPGPVELAIHLTGEKTPTGVGRLDGAALLRAAARAQVIWPDE